MWIMRQILNTFCLLGLLLTAPMLPAADAVAGVSSNAMAGHIHIHAPASDGDPALNCCEMSGSHCGSVQFVSGPVIAIEPDEVDSNIVPLVEFLLSDAKFTADPPPPRV